MSVKPSLLSLILLISLAAVSAVLFTPGLPTIATTFNVSHGLAQLTVSIFLLAYALGQPIYGPLANYWGRKKTLYFGIIIGIVGTLLCSISSFFDSFSLLVIGRFFMALGSSVGFVVTFTIINDVYIEPVEARKTLAYATLAFAIMPGLSIAVGGLIVSVLNWESTFYFMFIYFIFVGYLAYRLPETRPLHMIENINIKKILKRYGHLLKNKNLVLYACIWGFCAGMLYIYSASVPLIFIENLHMNPSVFGLWMIVPALGLALGNVLSANFAHYFQAKKVMFAGFLVSAVGLGLFFLFELCFQIHAITFFLSTFIFYSGLPSIYSNAAYLAQESETDKANAGSMVTFVDMCVATACVLSIGIFSHMTPMLMLNFFLGIFILMGIFMVVVKRKR